jgi:Zn-dependent M28 family amino/carboxypeptidase
VRKHFAVGIIPLVGLLAGCARRVDVASAPALAGPHADTVAISRLARDLADDSLRGRGPWTPENERVARRLAEELRRLGARPVFGSSLLVPFTSEPHPRDTVFNVIAALPSRTHSIDGELIGMTAHFDHLGVGAPDSTGDRIYNGFLDDAISIGMILDVARRYRKDPGDRSLVVMFFNLEEQGLLGSKTVVKRPDAKAVLDRMKLLIEVDAGSPAGEAMDWQLAGGLPAHAGARLADSLARLRGWTTYSTAIRPISDFYPLAQAGVPSIFPIPGTVWRNYSPIQRAAAMAKFDHYHSPEDEWRPDFPLIGTMTFADWLWSIVHAAADARTLH